ncbi:MAG: 3-dehydroquinate synthase family protein [Acidimicrobiales bacterium]
MGELHTVMVRTPGRTYPVFVGPGARHSLASELPVGVRRVAVVTQEGIPSAMVPRFDGIEVHLHTIGAGEEHKSLATVERLCREFSRNGMTRADLVVGVGGGMVTDVAGFTAASYHRGIAVMHVATSLLGMIDASVGGKTGVNIPEGKNLIGAFWQPSAVACDTDALDSLPAREMRCGTGEMAKYHFITREDLSTLGLVERIARSVEIKAAIVEADERESGERALLNYGHTLGHALETVTGYAVAHGEAVAYGLLYAAHLARVLGRIDDVRVEDHYRVVRDVYGLSTSAPQARFADLLGEMRRDKKAVSSLTFVLDSPSGLAVVPGVEESAAALAWDEYRAANP